MPTIIPQSFYLNGPTLSTSSSVFLDSTMLVCAPDGYYSDGFTVRQQVSCLLLPQDGCPTCGGVECGGIITNTADKQEYLLLNITVPTGVVGAVVVSFEAINSPLGFQATYDSVIYNEFSSPTYGYLTGTPSLPVFIGDTTQDCGISGGTYGLDEYLYNGTVFNPTGIVQTISVSAGQMALTATSPGVCVMVIPKLNPAAGIISIEIPAPCSVSNNFALQVACPVLLQSFNSSVMFESKEDPTACNKAKDQVYYSAPVNGTGFVLGLYDWVFADVAGATRLADGFYMTDDAGPLADYIEVQNGVIVDRGALCL